MKKSDLTANLSLKVFSVVIAVIIWLLVVNIDNPIITRHFRVPVVVQNEAYIESGGKMCLIQEEQDTTLVSVTGQRKTVENLTAEDITATADLKQIVDMNTDPVMVPISVSCDQISSGNLSASPGNMEIIIEEMMTQEYIINVTQDGQPGKGYEIGTVQANPEKVRITGPSSLIQKIDTVTATVKVDGATSDINATANLQIIDKNQENLSESQMRYLKYDIASPSVNVTVNLWKVRSNISIKADYTGTPAAGYKVDGVTMTPSEVSVAGSDEALNSLNQQGNVIWIPADYVNVSEKREDFETKVNLVDLLPEDLKLTTGTAETVIVHADIMPENSQEFTIPTRDIKIEKLSKGLDAVFETDKIDVRVEENGASLSALSTDDIEASINLSDKEEGSYEVPVEIKLPSGYKLLTEVKTEIKISGEADAEE